MSNNLSAQSVLISALNVLMQRRGNTTDAAEKTAINLEIDEINAALRKLDQADLLRAALIVSDAAEGLERLVAAARIGPFDRYLVDIHNLIAKLQEEQARMHTVDMLPPAPLPAAATAPAIAAVVAAPAPAAAGAPPASRPSASTDYAQLKAEYQAWFDAMKVLPGRQANVEYYVNRLLKFRAVYEATGAPLGIPWYFIGILHGMEGGFNFNTHLHNGDPLTARTVQVPKGRPTTGEPPFDWRDSARDAMVLKGYQHDVEWSIPRILYLFEKFNGMGYRPIGVPTPYLWSFSDRYQKGKFVSDHHYEPEAVSGQCGAALMLGALKNTGAL